MFDGSILVGASDRQSPERFKAIHPATGLSPAQDFSEARIEDVSDACALAEASFAALSSLVPEARARFLETAADAVAAIGDLLIETAMAETGLPRARLETERARTTGQLRLFAEEVRGGAWQDVVIDRALPERLPQPRPDIRRMNQPIGPVAVFGASNFPLAFSVAGGDTASALAAGCPVVIKGHPAHPATGELVARALRNAVALSGLPEGTVSYLPGSTHRLGAALVEDPRIKAVGFTGSRAAGTALMEIAAHRPEPIPVFAEMGSVNPVVLMPAALEARAEALGQGFVASLTTGAGQLCTNPGLVIGVDGPALDRFVAAASAAIRNASPQLMLTPAIHRAYLRGLQSLTDHAATRVAARCGSDDGLNRAGAALFETDAASFLADRMLGHENFGASAVLVRCASLAEVRCVLNGLEGQLTATIHLDPADETEAATLVPLLAARAGRVLANGWPTGVEVCRAMVHGGPFPAASDVRTTSVGTLAMMRFLRPVCYQNLPALLLPPALRSAELR